MCDKLWGEQSLAEQYDSPQRCGSTSYRCSTDGTGPLSGSNCVRALHALRPLHSGCDALACPCIEAIKRIPGLVGHSREKYENRSNWKLEEKDRLMLVSRRGRSYTL